MSLPCMAAGTVNSVRYHHDFLYGESSAIGKREKIFVTSYDMPGSWRRFMPKYGSGKTLFATCTATTVAGSFVCSHCFPVKAAFEIVAPSCVATAEDCTSQSFKSTRCCAAQKMEPSRRTLHDTRARMKVVTHSFYPFALQRASAPLEWHRHYVSCEDA